MISNERKAGVRGAGCTRVFETRTATGSELFSLLTWPHTTTFTLLSIFSPLEMSSIKIWETITVLGREMFSSGCRPRLKNDFYSTFNNVQNQIKILKRIKRPEVAYKDCKLKNSSQNIAL